MEDFYMNSTSQNQSFVIRDNTLDYQGIYIYINRDFTIKVVAYIIIAISLLLILVAIRALHSMVRSDHVAPIYVINLLIADILQFCCTFVRVAKSDDYDLCEIFFYINVSGVVASVYFMVCVALERYLIIAHPLWYHCRRTIKTSVGLCVLVWALSFVFILYSYFVHDYLVTYINLAVLLLLPLPLLIFFLVGSLRALSDSISVPSDEKRRIVGVLVLVLLIYMLLFLPSIIRFLGVKHDETLYILSFILVKLSPLADLVLYVFMRKGATDKLLASVCCCKMDSSEEKGEETGREMEASKTKRDEITQ